MKLGAEDRSKNGVQVFVFFSTRGQKSKYALPTCILKSNDIVPMKRRQVNSWSFPHAFQAEIPSSSSTLSRFLLSFFSSTAINGTSYLSWSLWKWWNWGSEMRKLAKLTVGLKARTQNMQFQFHDQCLFSIWGKVNNYFRYIAFELATWHPFWDMQPVNSGSWSREKSRLEMSTWRVICLRAGRLVRIFRKRILRK